MLNKKFLIRVLAVTVAATMTMPAAAALAEGMKEIVAETEDKKVKLGDVTAVGEKEDALEIRADGHKADVTTGSLERADRNGLFTYAEHNAEINVDVNYYIKVPRNGGVCISVELSKDDDDSGKDVSSDKPETVNLNFEGYAFELIYSD